MKTPRSLVIVTAALILAAGANAQTAPTGAGAPPAAAKAKPFSPGDSRAYLIIAEAMQFQLNMGLRLRSKYKETSPELVSFGSKIHKESTDMWTPGVDAAMAHGVDGKKIPQDMSKKDKESLTKINAIKDDKKWQLAYFEHYAKESRKNASDADKALKTVQDADLKEYAGKAVALLTSQAETVEAKYKELKAQK
jgi:hypothetical protein